MVPAKRLNIVECFVDIFKNKYTLTEETYLQKNKVNFYNPFLRYLSYKCKLYCEILK